MKNRNLVDDFWSTSEPHGDYLMTIGGAYLCPVAASLPLNNNVNNIFVNYPETYIHPSFSVCGGQGVSLWRDKGGERNSGNLAKLFLISW